MRRTFTYVQGKYQQHYVYMILSVLVLIVLIMGLVMVMNVIVIHLGMVRNVILLTVIKQTVMDTVTALMVR